MFHLKVPGTFKCFQVPEYIVNNVISPTVLVNKRILTLLGLLQCSTIEKMVGLSLNWSHRYKVSYLPSLLHSQKNKGSYWACEPEGLIRLQDCNLAVLDQFLG